MRLFFSLLVLLNLSLSSFANCYTGFACSIMEIENQMIKQIDKYNQVLNKYFSKKIDEDFFFNQKSSNLSYNDLFIFSTVL